MVFLLLIFFVITPILENGNRIEINLPNATVEQAESSFQAIEVAIESDGGVFVNGLPISNSNPMILKRSLKVYQGGYELACSSVRRRRSFSSICR